MDKVVSCRRVNPPYGRYFGAFFFINSSGLLWRNHKDESAVKETLDRGVFRFSGRMSLGETQLFSILTL